MREKTAVNIKETKLKHDFKIAEDFLDLRAFNTNALVGKIEEMIRLRETPVAEQIKMKVKKL